MWSSGAVVSLGPGTPGCSAEYGERANLLSFKEQHCSAVPQAASVGILHPPRPFAPERVHFWAQLARFAENFGGHLRFR